MYYIYIDMCVCPRCYNNSIIKLLLHIHTHVCSMYQCFSFSLLFSRDWFVLKTFIIRKGEVMFYSHCSNIVIAVIATLSSAFSRK